MKIRHMKTVLLIAAIVCLIILASPTAGSVLIGIIIVGLGELIRIWAAGHLIRNQEVTTSGPYAFVRDPLYLGRFFLIIGFCIMSGGYALYVLPVGLIVFFLNYLPRKYRKEKTRLAELFGETYIKYAASVKSLIPRVTPYPDAQKRSWSFSVLWNENREHYFLLIIVSICIAIIAKYFIQYS